MIRTFLWVLAGLVLGAIIHITVILTLPALASNDVWTKVTALGANDKPVLLPAIGAGDPNPLHLDPELAYAVCQIDLRRGPGTVTGTLPSTFWSVAVYNRGGAVIYSTTNRDGIGQRLELGVFNAVQTRLLAEQSLDIAEGLLIVESREDDIFVVVRVAPPHRAVRARYGDALKNVSCGNLRQ